MKSIKIFLGIVTVLLLIAIGLTVYVWYTLQSLKTPTPSAVPEVVAPTSAPDEAKVSSVEPAPAPIVIEKSDMSESQQKALETLGFTQESYTITSTMVTCAEGAVGKTRLAEITSGASPTSIESMKLLPCFKK